MLDERGALSPSVKTRSPFSTLMAPDVEEVFALKSNLTTSAFELEIGR
jgi:hypothetical protein